MFSKSKRDKMPYRNMLLAEDSCDNEENIGNKYFILFYGQFLSFMGVTCKI